MFKFEEGKIYVYKFWDEEIEFKVILITGNRIRLKNEDGILNKKILKKDGYGYFKPFSDDPKIIITAKQIKGGDQDGRENNDSQ